MTSIMYNMPPSVAELLRQGGTVHIIEDRAVMPAITQSSGSLPPLPKRKSLGRSKKQLIRAHSRPCRWANHHDSSSSLNSSFNSSFNSSLPSLMEAEDAACVNQEQGATTAAPMQAIEVTTSPTSAPKKPVRRGSVEHGSRAEYEQQRETTTSLAKKLESAKDLDDDNGTLPTVDESSSVSEDSLNFHDSFSSRTEQKQLLASQCQRFGLRW